MTYTPRPIDTRNITLSDEILELTGLLAENNHDMWARQRIAEGWTRGSQRDDKAKIHPDLFPTPYFRNRKKNTTGQPPWKLSRQ